MPEFLTLLPPDEARSLLLAHLSQPISDSERIDVPSSLGRILGENIVRRIRCPVSAFHRGWVRGPREGYTWSQLFPTHLSSFDR
jgi:hypothetical protein